MTNKSLNKQISKVKQDIKDNMSSIEEVIQHNISEIEWQYFYDEIMDDCFYGEEYNEHFSPTINYANWTDEAALIARAEAADAKRKQFELESAKYRIEYLNKIFFEKVEIICLKYISECGRRQLELKHNECDEDFTIDFS